MEVVGSFLFLLFLCVCALYILRLPYAADRIPPLPPIGKDPGKEEAPPPADPTDSMVSVLDWVLENMLDLLSWLLLLPLHLLALALKCGKLFLGIAGGFLAVSAFTAPHEMGISLAGFFLSFLGAFALDAIETSLRAFLRGKPDEPGEDPARKWVKTLPEAVPEEEPELLTPLKNPLAGTGRVIGSLGWAILALGVVVTVLQNGAPSWLAMDGVALVLIGLLIGRAGERTLGYAKHRKALVVHTRNLLWQSRQHLPLADLQDATICGRLQVWPLVVPLAHLEYGLALRDKAGQVVSVWPEDPAEPLSYEEMKVRVGRIRYEVLALRPADPVDPAGAGGPGRSPPEAVATKDPNWQEAIASGQTFAAGKPGECLVDVTTDRERFILQILLTLFVLSTGWLILTTYGFLQQNPRLIYLLLLDCTSVVATLLGVGRILVDDVLIFSAAKGRIEKSSRFLWMRKRVFLGTFDDVQECRVVRRSPGPHLIPHLSEMMAILRFRNGSSVRVSDVFWSEEIPRIRAIEINRLLSGNKPCATEDPAQIADPQTGADAPPPERSEKLRVPG